MPDRLSAQDAAFLYVERAGAPTHSGMVAIFAGDAGFEVTRITDLVKKHLAAVPRFRQRIRAVPGNLGNPVWIDAAGFDLEYHVRRSALPRPGSMEQLRELVGRVQSRPLDRRRPLWELYIVEGLTVEGLTGEGLTGDGGAAVQFALITKTHQALVDGVTAVDLGQLILGAEPAAQPSAPPSARPSAPAAEQAGELSVWQPAAEPRWPQLVKDALLDASRGGGVAIRDALGRLGGIGGLARNAVRLAGPPAPASPLNAATGSSRRFATVRSDLDVYRRIRDVGHAESGWTVNDVVLAVIAGALRSWLLSRGENVDRSAFLRALVPVSVREGPEGTGSVGTGSVSTGSGRVASYFIDLPVGEPDPAVRLHQVGHRMKAHNLAGERVGADVLAGLTGFAPPTLHVLGTRVAGGLSRRMYNLVITNAPGPQEPRYAAGARLLESYPVVPTAPGQALAIGVTSYLGQVCYGLNADRDVLPDVEIISECIEQSLEELDTAMANGPVRR